MEITVQSEAEIPALIERIVQQVTAEVQGVDFRPTFQGEVIPFLQGEHERYFNEESGPLGKWPALAPRTVKQKGFDTILIEHNNMRSSLLFDGPDHIEDVEERYMVWGTSDEKAMTHQEGDPQRRIPQRAFVGVTEQSADRIAELVADGIVAALAKE